MEVVISGVFQITVQYLQILLLTKILTRKFHVGLKECLFILLGFGVGIVFLHIGMFAALIMVFSLCFYTHKAQKYSLKKSIFISMLVMIITVLFDHITSISLHLILGETAYINEQLMPVHIAISIMLSILFTVVFTKATRKIRMVINQNEPLQMILPIISTTVLLFFYGNIMLHVGTNFTHLVVVNLSFMVAYIAVGAVVFYFYAKSVEEKTKLMLDGKEKEYYFFQNELMVETMETVKGMRHDMKLHLAALKDYIVNDPADAVDYVEYLMADLGEGEVYSDTGNVALDSIINYKLKDARVDGVQVDLKIFVPAVIGIDTPDVVVIVGNLLANAMDAVEKVADKFINLHVVYQKETLLIKVENSFDGVVKGEFETRKSGDGHGFGLKNVRKSVEKYDGKLDVEVNGDVFLVKVLLYGKEGS